jgi:hypothetical protein
MLIDAQTRTQLSEILSFIAEALDIPDDLYQEARLKYVALGEWLKADHRSRYRSDGEIYHQGSIRLGTSIRPIKDDGEYDIDLVYRREIQRESTTQEQLKSEVGEQLRRYIGSLERNGEPVPTLIEGRRCWTLNYKGRFHMDILPAIPDEEAGRHNLRDVSDGIIITDKELREWQPSNPKGYANWFIEKQEVLIAQRRVKMAEEARVDIETIPPERVPTPLRRVVQLLKRHRDIRYQGNPDDKPISIIITSLAAQAYGNQSDLFASLRAIVWDMRDGIEQRNGVLWIPNPVNSEENFADKWTEEPQKADRFFEWLGRVQADLQAVAHEKGINNIAKSLQLVFGEAVVNRGMKKYGDALDISQSRGDLRMAVKTGLLGSTGIPIKKNTWYGK